MTDYREGINQYQVELVNLADTSLSKVKLMICQLDFDHMKKSKVGRLLFVSNEVDNRTYLRRFLNIASNQRVDLLVFPELTISSEFIEELYDFSRQNDMYIVAGTHYKDTGSGYISVCPIVTPYGVFITDKITPSPFETSSFNGGVDGAIPGKTVKVFKGTKVGDFAVTICLDYTNDDLRNTLVKDSLDFLIVPAFNQKSDEFFYSMQSDVQRSPDGLYIAYSNAISNTLNGEGRSSLFAFMDKVYKSEFKDRGCTDLEPPNKIYEFGKDKSYCIFEVDLEHKKPYSSKNSFTETNVRVTEDDTEQMAERYHFQQFINSSDEKYLLIDKYYVKPREYDEMRSLLEKESVLVITGDPGIGKTYTAIHFLHEYYKKGYKPTWFYGMEKDDREIQKSSLLNFEPQERDVVYIEDPFGRTVFENRDELKTLFANIVERFRACKAKLIITSRTEVFNKYEKEVISGDILEDFKKELNVRNPSYSKEDLCEIAKRYIEEYTNWANNNKLTGIIYDGIKDNYLLSPFMVYNLVRNHPKTVEPNLLKHAVSEARRIDLVTQFADEIKIITYPSKILLYLVLLFGKKNITLIREMFGIVQNALFKKTKFEGSSFGFELKEQEGHRIQQLDEKIPVYRFSHPTYEEALIELVRKDSACAIIAETCMEEIIKRYSYMSVDIFQRFVVRYPVFLETLTRQVVPMGFDGLKESDKLELTRKMILSGNVEFQKKARSIYPVAKILDDLYKDDDLSMFVLRLRALSRRTDELQGRKIDWKKIFTSVRIAGLHASTFLMCCDLAYTIDDEYIKDIKVNLQKTDLVKKYILLPNEGSRERLNNILRNTTYKRLYDELKDIIPYEIMSKRNNKRKYVKILRKYILKREEPKGFVFLDDGAMMAAYRGAKIYPIGVLEVRGVFENGDIVLLVNNSGKYSNKILTVVELNSDEINKYRGMHSSEIYSMVGNVITTVISRPNLREIKKRRR